MLRQKLKLSPPNAIETEEISPNKKPKTEHIPNEEANTSSSGNCTSKFFSNTTTSKSIDEEMLKLQISLNSALKSFLPTAPVEYTYNPLEYAFESNKLYITKYCTTTKDVLFIGMNPGPFGMCQTGIPFGDVNRVRNWLKIEAEIFKPEKECPARPITGFSCVKKEESGDRFWGLLEKLFGQPETFFKNAFVYNYCPLAFMKSNGCNVTPSELKKNRKDLQNICDQFLELTVKLIQPKFIVGIGGYAQVRASFVCKSLDPQIKVLCMPHPSPRSVANNTRDWSKTAENFLIEHKLMPLLHNQH